MGCWNKTCGLTQMPIFHGEDVVMFFLIEDPFRHRPDALSSYSIAYWSPIPLPFYGKYDDYGHLEMDAGQEWKLQKIKQMISHKLVKRLKKGELTIDSSVFDDYEKLKEAIHDDRLIINLYGEKESIISFVMFERKIFDAMCAMHDRTALHQIFEKFFIYRNEVIELEAERLIKEKHFEIELAKEIAMERVSVKAFCDQENIAYYAGNSYLRYVLNYWFGDMGSEIGYPTRTFCREISRNINVDKNIQIDDMINTWIMHVSLDSMRKQWAPPGHDGSQDGLNPAHDVFLKAYTDRLNHIKHRYDESQNEIEGEFEDGFVTCPSCLGKGFEEFESDKFGLISSTCHYCNGEGIVSIDNDIEKATS